MVQLWVVVGAFALVNLAVFTVGIDAYDKYMGNDKEGVVEIQEVVDQQKVDDVNTTMEKEAPAANPAESTESEQ